MIAECMFCGRLRTDNSPKEWKKIEELDAQEVAHFNARRDLYEYYKSHNIKMHEKKSHGVCNYCEKIWQEDFNRPPEEVKELSLAL